MVNKRIVKCDNCPLLQYECASHSCEFGSVKYVQKYKGYISKDCRLVSITFTDSVYSPEEVKQNEQA